MAAVEGRRGEDDDSVPEEIEETCLEVHESLAGVDSLLKPVLSVSRGILEDRVSARLSVMKCYIILFSRSWTSWTLPLLLFCWPTP